MLVIRDFTLPRMVRMRLITHPTRPFIFVIIFLANKQTDDYLCDYFFGQRADKVIIFVMIFWPTSRQGDYFCIFSLCQVQVDDVDHLVNVHAGDVSLIFVQCTLINQCGS